MTGPWCWGVDQGSTCVGRRWWCWTVGEYVYPVECAESGGLVLG